MRAADRRQEKPIVAIMMQTGKVDPRVMLFCGLCVTGASTMWQAGLTTSDSSFGSLVLPLVFQGIGSGMLFAPLLFSVVGSLKDLFVTLGGSIASASLVTLLDRREDLYLDTLDALVNLRNIPIHNLIVNAHGLTQNVAAALAFADIFLLTGALTLISVPLILGSPKPTTTVPIEVG